MKKHLQLKILTVAEKGWMEKMAQRHRLSSGSSQAEIYHNRPDPKNICTEFGLLFL